MLVLPPAADAAPQAGVKAGDWARYNVSQHVTGNETLVKDRLAQYGAYAKTNYVSLNITSVDGTNVSLTQGIHYTNGTIYSSNSTVDVSVFDPNNPPVVIMQNMPTLSSLTMGNFSRVSRTINNFFPPSDASSALRYSWDEDTGILLSEQFLYNVEANQTNTATFTFVFAITETSLWHYVPPTPGPNNIPPVGPFGLQFTELYALVGIIGSLALGLAAYAVKRSPKNKGRSRISPRDPRSTNRELNPKKSTKK